jgi:hypothetical protein
MYGAFHAFVHHTRKSKVNNWSFEEEWQVNIICELGDGERTYKDAFVSV